MKRIATILLTLALALCALPTLALAGEVQPPRLPTLPAGISLTPSIRRTRAAGPVINTLVEPVLGETAKWQIDTGVGYRYGLLRCNPEDNVYHYIYMSGSDFVETSVFTYIIRETGDYWLTCDVLTADDTWSTATLFFTVTDLAGAESVQSKVREIVGLCPPGGEYEKALWLHDWLTENAHYDRNYQYYGPDGVLFLGKGVCDSYSKAYNLLLEAAGIESMRITGKGNGGDHAWNAVKIDGQWCMVDVTWDDPISEYDYEGKTESGYERHDYFGLNEELLTMDHTIGADSPYVACTTLDNSYAKRSREYMVWMDHIRDLFMENLADGQLTFDVATQGRVMVGDGYYYSRTNAQKTVDRCTLLACALMSEDLWAFVGGRDVAVNFTYEIEGPSDGPSIHCDVPVETDLVLPSGLTLVDESAFENADSVYGVLLGAGVERVAANAFAGCDDLMWVVFAEGDVQIDDSAFADVPSGFVIVCPLDSAVSGYAADKGYAQANR